MTLHDAAKMMAARGGLPIDVMVNRAGDKLPAAEAVKKDIQWDVIYFRSDGYTLAADFYLGPYVMTTCTDPNHPWIGKLLRGQKAPVAFPPVIGGRI
jgi:hypothetical protein